MGIAKHCCTTAVIDNYRLTLQLQSQANGTYSLLEFKDTQESGKGERALERYLDVSLRIGSHQYVASGSPADCTDKIVIILFIL